MILGNILTPAVPCAGPSYATAGFKRGVNSINFSVGAAGDPTYGYLTRPESGVVTMDLESGIATFSTPQTDGYIGIGDEVTYLFESFPVSGYLSRKISTRKWALTDASGNPPVNISGATVVSIKKTFNSLEEAIHGASSGALSKIGNPSLIGCSAGLNITCYDLGADDSVTAPIQITGWTTDESHYISILTPYSVKTQCNSSQRHKGKWGNSGYSIAKSSAISSIIEVYCAYTEIEGLRMDGANSLNVCIKCDSGSDDSKILNNIAKRAFDIFYMTNLTTNVTVEGNVIYDAANDGIYDYYGVSNCINNTIIDCGNYGIETQSSAVWGWMVNNLIQNCTNGCIGSPTVLKAWNNTIDDTSLAASQGNIVSYDATFVDEVNNDFLVDYRAGDDILENGAVPSSIDSSLKDQAIDVEGEKVLLPYSKWYRGADCHVRIIYAAAGSSLIDLKTGTGNASVTSGVITFDDAQVDNRLCAGCLVKLDTSSIMLVLYKKVSGTQWLVTNTSGEVPSDISSNAIEWIRAYTMKELIEDYNLSGLPQISQFGWLGSADLLVENRRYFIACSYGDIDEPASSSAFIVDEAHYIRIFAPSIVDTDCNSSRKHNGKRISNILDYYPVADQDDLPAVLHDLTIAHGYTEIDGIQATADDVCIQAVDGAHDLKVVNNILYDAEEGVQFDTNDASESSVIANNIIYSMTGKGIDIKHRSIGQSSFFYIYNNTIDLCEYGVYLEIKIGDPSNIVTLVNNIAQNSTEKDFHCTTGASDRLISISNFSKDASIRQFIGTNDNSLFPVEFRNREFFDYNLSLFDHLRMDHAENLSADPNYAFTSDCAGDERDLWWNPGADVWPAPAQKEAHFSIGQEVSSLVTPDVLTMTISDGILTFGDEEVIGQDIGVGDKVTYNTSSVCYLAERGTSNKWRVVDNQGAPVSDEPAPLIVNSVLRVSNSLKAAMDGTGAGIESELSLGDQDLVAADIKLSVWCYYDNNSPDLGDTAVSGWTTDMNRNITISTPWNLNTQCSASQRHLGTWASGGFVIETDETDGVRIDNSFATLEGARATAGAINDAVTIGAAVGMAVVYSNIIKDSRNGVVQDGSAAQSAAVIGNIIYDVVNDGINVNRASIVSNTIVGCGDYGINTNASLNCWKANNIVQDCTDCYDAGSATDYNNIADDATLTAGTDNTRANILFVDKGDKDFHLTRADFPAINNGIDIYSTAGGFRFSRDIDRAIISTWSRGAESAPLIEALDLYFSVGNNTDDFKSLGFSTVTILSGVMYFSEEQDNDNVGIGNKVTYDGTKTCYLRRKISNTQWEVTTKWGALPDDEIVALELNHIIHPFYTIRGIFLAGASGISQLLGDSICPFFNLDTSNVKLHFPVYKAATPQNLKVVISNFITSEDYYINIYTPYDTLNECNTRQRHIGYYQPDDIILTPSSPSGEIILIENPYVTIDGLVLDSPTIDGIVIVEAVAGTSVGNKLIGNLILRSRNGIRFSSPSSQPDLLTVIANNVVSDCTEDGISSSGNDIVTNNTVVDCGGKGFDNFPTDILINNIAQTCLTGSAFNDNTTIRYCISDDVSAGSDAVRHNRNNLTIVFEPGKGCTLARVSESARGTGYNLSGGTAYGFDIDCAGTIRGRFWDRGAIEYIPTRRVCYSVGASTDDVTSRVISTPITYAIRDSVMTFSQPQIGTKFGIGNEVVDDFDTFPDKCLLLEKIDDYQWIVTDKFGNSIANRDGIVTRVVRVFNTLPSAESLLTGIFSPAYLDATNLVGIETRVTIAFYDDGNESGAAINMPTLICDPDYYLRLVVSRNLSKEVNQSQRHDGRSWTTGYSYSAFGSETIAEYAMKFSNTNYLEIEGMKITKTDVGKGLVMDDCRNYLLYGNIIYSNDKKISNAIDAIVEGESVNVIANNLIYLCSGDAIVSESINDSDIMTYLYNNTIVKCGRGVYFKRTLDSEAHLYAVNNIIQESAFKDFVEDHIHRTGYFHLYNNISEDETSKLFSGADNIPLEYINFVNRDDAFGENDYDLNELLDTVAMGDGDDLHTDTVFPFNEDIQGRERVEGEWDIGAFEMAEVVNSDAELAVGPIRTQGTTTATETAPTLTLHLRSPGPAEDPHRYYLPEDIVSEIYQFTSIADMDAWLIANPYSHLAFHLKVCVQGGISFSGALDLGLRGALRTVMVETYPLEIADGPGVIIYPEAGPLVSDASSQSLLTFDHLKIYCAGDLQNYLLDNTAQTTAIKFINCIIQVNNDSVIDNITTCTVQAFNSTIVYRNTDSGSTALYLVKNGLDGNNIANTTILSYNATAMTFKTSTKSFTACAVQNNLAYNYGGSISFIDDLAAGSVVDHNPNYFEVELEENFGISQVMSNSFKPKLTSPLINAGNNAYVTSEGIEYDIIGSPRIFESETVDIGHYEVAVHKLKFGMDNIKKIFQDKLTLDYADKTYSSSSDDVVYTGLYDQFVDNPIDRDEFTRECKIVMRLKTLSNDFKVFSDKKEVELFDFVAYFDDSTNSIIITKDDELFSGLFNNIFGGEYSFYFNEVTHSLKVYLKDTYSKGLSGERNIVKNVRFGGASVLSS